MEGESASYHNYHILEAEKSTGQHFELFDGSHLLANLCGTTASRIRTLFLLHNGGEVNVEGYNCHGLTRYLLQDVPGVSWDRDWEPKRAMEMSLEEAQSTFRFPIGIYVPHFIIRTGRYKGCTETHTGLIVGQTVEGTPLAVHKIGEYPLEFCSPETVIAYGHNVLPRFFGRPQRKSMSVESATPPAHSHR